MKFPPRLCRCALLALALIPAATLPAEEFLTGEWKGDEHPEFGQRLEGKYLVTNHTAQKVTAQVQLILVPDPELRPAADLKPSGPPVAEFKKSVTLAANGSAEIPFTTSQVLLPGSYSLLANVASPALGSSLSNQHRIFGMTEPLAKVGPESMFGIDGSDPKLAPLIRRLGVGWFRYENLKWAMVSPAPGEFAYDGTVKPWELRVDDILKGYRDLGISLCPMMFMTPQHASSAGPEIPENRRYSYPPRDNAEATQFWFQTAARYGKNRQVPPADLKTTDKRTGLDLVQVYEIWNEMNLHDPGWGFWVGTMDQYFQMFRPAAEAVKKADPQAIVSSGAYAGTEVKLAQEFLDYKYPDGKCPLDFVDLLNMHFYTGRVPPELATSDPNVYHTGRPQPGRPFEDEVKALCAWRDEHKPGLPIWITETGYDSAGPYGLSEPLQAARIPRMLMLALGNGIGKVFLYREGGSSPQQHGASGIFRNDGTMKPSFFSYATLIRTLDGAQPTGRIDYPDKNVRLYGWKRGDKQILSAWAVEGEAEIDLPLGDCTVTDTFGSAHPARGLRHVRLTEFPSYFLDFADLTPMRTYLESLQKKPAAGPP